MGTIDLYALFNTRMNRRSFTAGAIAAGGLAVTGLTRPGGASAAPAYAAGDTVYTATDLNFRDAPGIDGKVLSVLPASTMLHIYDGPFPADGWTWYKAAVEAVDPPFVGYAAGEYLTPVEGGGTQYPVGVQVQVVTDRLNVRDAPRLSGAVLATEPNGAIGTVTASNQSNDGYSWIEVRFPDVAGWVASEYVAPIVQDGPKFAPDTPVYVNSGPLNLRDAPSLTGAIIASLPESTLGTILDGPVAADDWVWYKLRTAGGAVGWAVEDYLSVASVPVEGDIGPGATIKVVDGPLNIRSGPGSSYAVIDRAATGAVADVIDGPVAAGGYTWIKIDGNLLESGWVAYEFCQAI